MNIAIVDDQLKETTQIKNIIKKYFSDNHTPMELKIFHSAEDFLAGFSPFQYTLIFMDIYMDGMSGLEAARQIRKTDNDTHIVFLTTSSDHTFDAFDVHAYQYILKTPDKESLRQSIYQVIEDVLSIRSIEDKQLIISVSGEEISLPFSNIVYAQSQKNYIQITDRFRSRFRTRMTFSELRSSLDRDNRFLQINRGILINMDYITTFESETCNLKGGYSLPINLRDQKKLNQIRKNYIFSKLHNRRTAGRAAK